MKYTGKQIIDILLENNLLAEADAAFLTHSFSDLSYNSLETKMDDLFVCKGRHFQEDYLLEAENRGAVGYLSEKRYTCELPMIKVNDAGRALALLSARFCAMPQEKLKVFGVTGTNGKTTTVHYLASILEETVGNRPGYTSTIDSYNGKNSVVSYLTTPEAPVTYHMMKNTVEEGIPCYICECSSQAQKMQRLFGLEFDYGIFLNISDDHYSDTEHRDFNEYFADKLAIVKQYKNAVINYDDPHRDKVLAAAGNAKKILTFSASGNRNADIYAETIECTEDTVRFTIVSPSWQQRVTTKLPGLFNVENALAAAGAAYLYGASGEQIARGILQTYVEGRMMLIQNTGFTVVVDYAHNGESVIQLLTSVKQLFPDKKIKFLYGCTGDTGIQRRRDVTFAAAPFCSFLYITTDDPQSMDPEVIIRDLLQFVQETNCPYEVVTDRSLCVEKAVRDLKKEEVLVIAAKGCERYIKVQGKRIPYEGDDRISERVLLKNENVIRKSLSERREIK